VRIVRTLAAIAIAAALARGGRSAAAPQSGTAPDIFFAPTWEPVVDEMLALAKVTRDDVVYDLGSGDGRILIRAAQKYGARGVGIEIDPRLVEISRQVARDGEVADKVTFISGNLFDADISPATVVTVYLSYSVNSRLAPKLRRELRPGTRIVSHQFTMGTWEPDARVRSAEDGTDLFLWIVAPR
jgi:cyclopropane fatty-acyl-phospholipid synthase-like methyltransferase